MSCEQLHQRLIFPCNPLRLFYLKNHQSSFWLQVDADQFPVNEVLSFPQLSKWFRKGGENANELLIVRREMVELHCAYLENVIFQIDFHLYLHSKGHTD